MAHILIVDDRPLNREFLIMLLGYYGHTLAEAADGVEALARVAERRPDLVITDLLMPNMDGEEFTRRLRADAATKNLPVIIYTATYRAREARAIADRVGVRQVLAKPCEPKDIVRAVNEALGTAGAAAQPPAPGTSDSQESVTAAPGKEVAQQLNAVEGLNLRLAQLLESAVQIAEEQAKSLTAVRGLENALQNVQALGLRLTTLVELGLDLAQARDAQELIELFCRALQNVESSRYAGVVVIGGVGEPLRRFAARGLDDATRARVAGEIAGCTATKRMLGQGNEGKLMIGVKTGDATGLPDSHPPVRNFLACPIAAREKSIGWLYVADRLGKGGFSTDDERIAMALGAQFATAWDSLGLYTELERLVAARTTELQSANRELEAFSYSVSHDLRAPLRAISGYTGMLVRDHGPKLPPEAQKLCTQVQENVSRMGALIEDLLEFSRLGRKALSVQRLNLAHLARECLKELKGEQEGRKVEVTIADLPPCHGDVILLKQVLLNLLSNALKYSRNRDSARVEVGAEIRNGEYVCHVRDNGVGFDMRYAGKLFEVFQRLHSQSEFAGTGVGLAIVRRAIEKHGGKVWAEAAPDQGATFYFSLPAGHDAQVG